MLIADHPQNENDGVFRRLKTPAERATVLSEFLPLPNSVPNLLQHHANFDLVPSVTPNKDTPT